jgi:hypothetical protein
MNSRWQEFDMVSFPVVTSIAWSGGLIFSVSSSILAAGIFYRRLDPQEAAALAVTAALGLSSMLCAYRIYEAYLIVTTGTGYEQFDQLCYGTGR